MAKILLVDVDSKIPNLALMKLSRHHRMIGDDVELVRLRGGKALLDLFTFDQDMHRFEVLRSLGVLPYVMRYNFRRDDKQLNKFARWVNAGGAGYRSVPWEQYRVKKGEKNEIASNPCI